MYKSLFTIIILLYSASSYAKSESPPASTITFIAQIDHVELNKTALSHDMKLVLADRFYFKTSNPCETNSISARPESMGLTDKAYADKLKKLETPFLDDRYFFMTINQCDGNGTPMLTDIKVCTTELCGAEYTKKMSTVWLDETLKPTAKRLAIYFIQSPLPYDDEKKQWKVTGWYISSTDNQSSTKQIAFEGYTDTDNFSDSKFISSFKSWFESGKIKNIANYNPKGERDGKYESYYNSNGNVYESLSFSNDLINGEFITYYENGAIESKRHFNNGKIKDGECPHFYEDGKIKQQHSYLNSKLDGPAYEYYPDGKLMQENFYQQSVLIGKDTSYYQSGKISSIHNRNSRGQYDGANERYSEEGKLLSKSVYKDGKQISVQTWYENGQKEEEKHFDEQGQLNGLVKQWYKNGNLAKSQNYKHDILDGNSEEWYENGIPESLYPYKNGKTDGIAKSWNKYGKLTYSIEYKNGVENGAYRNWSKNTGKLTKETLYVNGIRQGVEKEFNDRTGKLLTSTQYVNNKRHGTEETYDQNGIKYITCYQNDQKLSSLDNPTQIKDNATTGDSSAQFALGKYEFICVNIDEGIKWLTKSAEQKNTDAIYFLATAYKGNGIPANNEKYLAYLQQAATLGSSNAQAEIGYLYLIGKELPQNLPDAGVWFKKAAAQGNFAAHFYLGRMYQNGDGVERNMEKARFHLSNAAEGGIEPALKALNELEHQTK